GSMSTLSRRCSAGWTSIRKRCASGARPSSIVRHNQGPEGATHFLMKTLPRVAAEMALHVLAYNLTRVMNIMGVQPLLAAMRAQPLYSVFLFRGPKDGSVPGPASPKSPRNAVCQGVIARPRPEAEVECNM